MRKGGTYKRASAVLESSISNQGVSRVADILIQRFVVKNNAKHRIKLSFCKLSKMTDSPDNRLPSVMNIRDLKPGAKNLHLVFIVLDVGMSTLFFTKGLFFSMPASFDLRNLLPVLSASYELNCALPKSNSIL